MMNGPRIEPRPPQAMIRPIENSLIFSSARCGTSIRAHTLQMAYSRNIIADSLIRIAGFITVLGGSGSLVWRPDQETWSEPGMTRRLYRSRNRHANDFSPRPTSSLAVIQSQVLFDLVIAKISELLSQFRRIQFAP